MAPVGGADFSRCDVLATPSVGGSKERSLAQILHDNMRLVSKAVSHRESRLAFGRVLRTTAAVRSQFNAEELRRFFYKALRGSSSLLGPLIEALAEVSMHDISEVTPAAITDSEAERVRVVAAPELELYCCFLLCQYLCDCKRFDQVYNIAEVAVDHARMQNQRTLDVLSARCTFYLSLAAEATGKLSDLRPKLLGLHATAVLNHDDIGQETLLNLLLHNYLHHNLVDQAEKFRAQAQRPEAPRSNQQYCRYLFYLGRIRAVQLEYSDSKECLQQAARKAPMVAKGFRLCVHKWLTVIRLLLGEMPSVVELNGPASDATMQPYLALTAAVRSGDVSAFNGVAAKNSKIFLVDQTYNLINRLRYNVLRAGLRRISVAYLRISLQDVASKLGLKDVADTEAIIAKTIRDGSILARLDHEKQYLVSRERCDSYITDEPACAFHARTAFCMDIHNEAVRAMRYDTMDHDGEDELGLSDTQPDIEGAIAAAMADEGDF